MSEEIPFVNLKSQFESGEHAIRNRIDAVLAHGKYIMGPEVHELESRLEQYTGSEHCISVASGTEALLISLMALGIGPGDEVLTTPFTFVATVEVIVLLGAKPVFIDVELDTCVIDASLIEEKITSKSKAIIPVSLYGQPADMDKINQIASKHKLKVIEDSAQSLGATYKSKKSCNLSDIACTSFFPSKPLGCYGDGGAIFTNDATVAQVCKEIRIHGQSERYVHTRVGVGGRMDTIQCAIVLAKLERFDWEVSRRLEIGLLYNDAMDTARINRVEQRADRTSIFAQYTIMVDDRDRFRSKLSDHGIPTAVHYPIPLNEQVAYRALCCPECTPVASKLATRVVSLPMSADLSSTDQQKIIDSVVTNA